VKNVVSGRGTIKQSVGGCFWQHGIVFWVSN